MLEFNFNWDKLSVSAGLTLRNFYFRLYPGAIGELEVIDFLKALVRHIDGPLLIVWDRLPAHRSGASSRDHIATEYLPPYAPELNPVEYIWAYWKQHELPNVCPKDYWERRARPQSAAANAPQTALDYRFLETVFSLSRLTVYYAQPPGAGVHPALRGSHRNGVLAALCAGVEPGGIHLGVLEAARVAQRLPEGLLGTRRARPQSAAANAPQTALDYRFLETVFSLSRLTVYYARLSKPLILFEKLFSVGVMMGVATNAIEPAGIRLGQTG